MKVKNKTILKELKSMYDVELVKYDVFSKSFIYKFPNSEEKSITFDTLLNTMNQSKGLYNVLDELKSSYFPRRLKEVVESFYIENDLPIPSNLLIGEKGFEIIINDKINYVEYHDDFDIFLKEMSNLYKIENKDFKVHPKIEDYAGHYHKNK